jgi:hypothetical protein
MVSQLHTALREPGGRQLPRLHPHFSAKGHVQFCPVRHDRHSLPTGVGELDGNADGALEGRGVGGFVVVGWRAAGATVGRRGDGDSRAGAGVSGAWHNTLCTRQLLISHQARRGSERGKGNCPNQAI